MEPRIGIIGGGPAGLTAAYELVRQKKLMEVIVYEAEGQVGGLSRTIDFNGNKTDIGGHRFFSKSDRIMKWWSSIMPLETEKLDEETRDFFSGHQPAHGMDQPVQAKNMDEILMVRNRLSRIYYKKKFYNYPLALNIKLFRTIGVRLSFKILISYLKVRLRSAKPECSLEDFFINRFGKELYYVFFKDYTEKVWGKPCSEISPEWGAQRIKRISIGRIIVDMLHKAFFLRKSTLRQKKVETSLINCFLYPKYGPGQMWEVVERKVKEAGGCIKKEHIVIRIVHQDFNVQQVHVMDYASGKIIVQNVDHLISSMPIVDLVNCMSPALPDHIRDLANRLEYRDFMVVGVLLDEFELGKREKILDNWIYINDPDVKVGRIQVFNNWSPYMVKDPATYWIGMEYFVNIKDEVWNLPDDKIKERAFEELISIGFCRKENILDSVVMRVPKAYPGYYGAYKDFPVLKDYLNQFGNLYLVGRNGMHKYNNQDHSMLTAMEAVNNIVGGVVTKDNIWAVNNEQEYIEQRTGEKRSVGQFVRKFVSKASIRLL